MKTLYVYILRCSDDSYYTGVTNNVEIRLWEHSSGTDTSAYTYSRRPVELVYCAYFNDPLEAIAHEKQIKGWTRKKKEALIAENWEKLKELAGCKNFTSHKHFQSSFDGVYTERSRSAQDDNK